jgi:ATP-dependent DNA helicase PIF1
MATVHKSLFPLFKQRPEWKELTKLQKEFFYQFFTRRNIFLTGAAGVGKSFCISLLTDFLQEQDIFFGVTATTGVAALNVGGSTIHSWSGMGLADEEGMRLLDKVSENRKAFNRIKQSKVLIIDEISMAKADLIEKLDIVCQFIRNSERPFGGIQVIFVGDFLQLPPVFNKFERESFAFEAPAWKAAKVYTLHLSEIVRQHDEPAFAEFLNEVRVGTRKDFDILNECINREFPEDGIVPVKLFCKNIDVDRFNQQELEKIKTPSKRYYSVDEGGEQWKQFFDKNCRAPSVLELKVGAQVMLLKNMDVAAGLVNGSVGVVEKMHSDSVEVKFTTGETHVVEAHKWELKQIEDDGLGNMLPKLIAARKQIPLKLAWALTTHKAQGATLDRAELSINDAFADGQVYVALSRVRNLRSLRLNTFHPSKISVNQKCLNFYNERPPMEEDFFEEVEA